MESLSRGDYAAEARALDETDSASEHSVVDAGRIASDAESWRREVAARLETYRSRRKPRAPRYPSLFLPFEPGENRARAGSASEPTAATPAAPTLSTVLAAQATALPIEERPMAEPPAAPSGHVASAEEPVSSAKIIEFPRSAVLPGFQGYELAEPVLDRPRIVEAPEIVPLPPALGGMLIEPATPAPTTKPVGDDLPLHSATTARRMLAGLVDTAILGAAVAGVAAIVMWMNPGLRLALPLAGGLAAVAVVLWMAYEFMFLVYSGTTPGLLAAKLRLTRFDGSEADRRIRRWRVLASFLSAFSIGLGYLWSLLDESGLCWHDRITRTCLLAANET